MSESGGSSASGSSQTSFSGTGGSSVISNDNSEAGALARLSDKDQDASLQDLLQQNKSFWDAAFSCALLLTKNRAVRGYRMLVFRVVFEYLQIFRLVFNTRFLWVINTDLWIWKAFYWVLFRFLIWDMGYSTYVLGMYIICAVVLTLAVLTMAVAFILRKEDSKNVWLARLVWVLQNGALLVFSICWVAVVDYLVFMFTCSWGTGNNHLKWTTMDCTEMPHLASMAFGMAVAILTVVVVLTLTMAECSGNLVSDNLMAAPVAETALKTTALKVVMVCVSTCLDQFPQPQAVLMFLCPCLSAYFQVRSSPYLLPWMNHLWTGLWLSLVYTTGLQLSLQYTVTPNLGVPGAELVWRESLTWAVLYGIFPSVLLGMGISYLLQRWKDKPIKLFEAARQEAAEGRLHIESVAVLKKIYRFHEPDQVAFLARCVRRFDKVTDEVLPEAASLCNLIIQAGLARFPGDPTVLLVYANYIIHVKKEPRAARQQLQLASKGEPNLIERYNIFSANDMLKRNRSDSDQGLDLMAYVEFQRNYRACVKAHKMALLAQRAFWRGLLRDTLQLNDILTSFKSMEAAEQVALSVYKRVLERYPQNGKLLKVWGRFQEWVLHDPSRAARSYAEAIKRGLGDNMLNLTSDDDQGAGISKKVDEKTDGVVIIDAVGTILMVNKVAYRVFGYERGDLDGKNVSILMPRPFSDRHDSYLSNYLTTGNAKILNSDRSVVGLRKDHSLFPLSLMVTRLSGQGLESVFMGVLRVAEDDGTTVRAWCTMTGTVMCCDAKLAEWLGVNPVELTGHQVSSLGTDQATLASFVADAVGPKRSAATRGELVLQTGLMHRFLQQINIKLTTGFAGTDNEPVLVLYMQSQDEAQRMMVVDEKLKIMHCSESLAKMLGTSTSTLTTMQLSALIAPPAAQLHKRWMLDMGSTRPQPGSCRAGGVAHMLSVTGAKVPVRLEIKTVDSTQNQTADEHSRMHIVKVHRASDQECLDSRCVTLTVDQRGVVLAASNSPKTMFGFNPQADLIGQPLAAFINVFEDFRVKQQQQAGHSSSGKSSSGFGGTRAVQEQYSRLALQIAPAPDPNAGPEAAAPSVASDGTDDSVLLTLLANAAQEGREACYRVGVRPAPLAAGQIGKSAEEQQRQQQQGAAAGMSTLLQALGKRTGTKLQAAIMRIDVVEPDWTQEDAGSQGIKFRVELVNTDILSGCLELDDKLKVVKPDPAVSQMLGVMSVAEMRGKSLNKLLKLPKAVQSGQDLLVAGKAAGGKASALKKKHKGSEVAVGPVMEVEAMHADGLPLKLQLQGVGKDSKGHRVLLRVKICRPSSVGSLDGLLRLCATGGHLPTRLLQADHAAPGAQSHKAPAAAAAPRAKPGLHDSSDGGSQHSREGFEGSHFPPGRKGPAAAADGSREPGRGLRFAAGEESYSPPEQHLPRRRDPAPAKHGKGRPRADSDGEGGGWDNEPVAHPAPRGVRGEPKWEQLRSPKGTGPGAQRGPGSGYHAPLEDEYDDPPAGRASAPRKGRIGLGAEASSVTSGEGAETDVESRGYGGQLAVAEQPPGMELGDVGQPMDGDGASEMASEDEMKLDGVGTTTNEGDDEDLTCDWRRAKRLRRILRQLESPAALAPLARFWRGTWGVVLVLLVAHIICYAVLSTVLDSRNRDVVGVQQLANAVDRSQMIMLRANFIAKCANPAMQNLAVCSASQRQVYISKSMTNVATLQKLHEGVFLGTDKSKVTPLSDNELYEWWMLPRQSEIVYFDTDPPTTTTIPISLWNLGNKFISAAKEVNYAYSTLNLDSTQLENLRFWQYVMENGKETLYKAYAISLDLYVLFCWHQLGGLSTFLTGLLIAELIAVALAAMLYQLDSVRRVCKQRMACFSVFLALPSATLRTMATAPCQVDEDDQGQDEDDDELEMLGGGAQSTVDADQAGADAAGGASSNKANKSVRLAVEEAAPGDAKGASSKPKKLLSRHKGNAKELTGIPGWVAKKYRSLKHAARGTFNRPMKVNGKKLHPARGAFSAFMLPLLAWWIVAIVIYGVSFQKVAMLQAPLTSMQVSAHVQFDIARVRMLSNMLGFLFDGQSSPERIELLRLVDEELERLRSEYFTMLYGGTMVTSTGVTVTASSALFRDPTISNLFFNTKECLRNDKSTCWGQGSKWHDATHNGIDAMVQRLFQEVTTFAKLPPVNQTVDTPSYEYTWRVAANDLYDGLAQVSDVFVGTTIKALEELHMLHTYLLIASIVVFVAVVVVMLVPFRKKLLHESKKLAGLLSQLPQESDVEGHVKQLVIDAATGHKPTEATKQNWSLARGVTAAATAAARAAASRAAGAVGNMKARMAEASAANAAAAAAAQSGGWQQYQDQEQEEEDDASSAPEWE